MYIVIEGTEGVGKSTQTKLLSMYLDFLGKEVVSTKEPGTPLSPLSMRLRDVMLNNVYGPEMTSSAREFISQAIRSIHIEKIVIPALAAGKLLVQDRGMLSGLAYGEACGNKKEFILSLAEKVCEPSGRNIYQMYDHVVYLRGDPVKGLGKAISSKQEFSEGDAIEAKGTDFIIEVGKRMDFYSSFFNSKTIDVRGKSIAQVFRLITGSLGGEFDNEDALTEFLQPAIKRVLYEQSNDLLDALTAQAQELDLGY